VGQLIFLSIALSAFWPLHSSTPLQQPASLPVLHCIECIFDLVRWHFLPFVTN
jgi:hypothetical protein